MRAPKNPRKTPTIRPHKKTVAGQGALQGIDLVVEKLVGVRTFELPAPASRIQVLDVN